jgi:hypothetical protein
MGRRHRFLSSKITLARRIIAVVFRYTSVNSPKRTRRYRNCVKRQLRDGQSTTSGRRMEIGSKNKTPSRWVALATTRQTVSAFGVNPSRTRIASWLHSRNGSDSFTIWSARSYGQKLYQHSEALGKLPPLTAVIDDLPDT